MVHESSAREWCTRERLRGLVSKQPAVSSLACVREVEANFSRLGMGPPGEAGSRKVEACRGGDVVEAGVQAILLNLAEVGLLIYSDAGSL